MNLNDIIQAAQGGQGVNNLASQFGLSPEQTQAAIQAMIPAFSGGLQSAVQNPGALGGILAHLASGAHDASYVDPSQATAAAGAGGDALSNIFGSPQVAAEIGQHAAQMSGVDAQTIQQMLPVVASMLLGGLSHSLNSQGLGGLIGQLAGAANAPGGLAGSLEQGAASPAAGGMLGGLVSSVLGGLFGGAQPQQAGAQASAGLQAGLSTLTGMLESGIQVSQAHQQGLNNILQSLTNPVRN
jgi:hypothetical protein